MVGLLWQLQLGHAKPTKAVMSRHGLFVMLGRLRKAIALLPTVQNAQHGG